MVFIKSCQIETQPTFVEYLQGGVSMNFSVAVDFTASNGDPRQPQSLHFFDPTRGGKMLTLFTMRYFPTDFRSPLAKLPQGKK